MPRLAAATHGESRLRLLRVVRRGDRHDPRDLTVSVRFEGSFEHAFVDGSADGVVPRETLKALVASVVRAEGAAEIESIALVLAERVLKLQVAITRVRVDITEQPWARLVGGGKPQGQAFSHAGPEQRTVSVTSNGSRSAVVAGLEHLLVMRTSGFLPPRTERTDDGLQDAVQPLLLGSITARWTYGTADLPFAACRQSVRAAIVDTFALHAAGSVQHTLYAIGDVVLATYEDILEVTLAMEERPHRPGDLFGAAAENVDDLFVMADEPLRLVQVTVERERPVR